MMTAGGAGLASTQVREAPGGEAWRILVLRTADNSWGALVNPVITLAQGTTVEPEGCLSFASVHEPLPAPEMIAVDFRDVHGKALQMALTDHHARAVWHEVKHLDGELIVDRMKPLQRKLFLKAVAKVHARRVVWASLGSPHLSH
jgi:peptide deformylase